LEQIKIQNESSNFNLNNIEFEANVANIVNNTSIMLDKEDSNNYNRNDLSSEVEVQSHVTNSDIEEMQTSNCKPR